MVTVRPVGNGSPRSERHQLTAFFASVDHGDVIALPPDPERHDQGEGHDQAQDEANRRGVADPTWLFWHRQAAAAFDGDGNLTGPLRVNWGGDHARIAALLATLPEPFRVTDHGPGGVFEISSAAATDRAAAPFPDVADTTAVKARVKLITAHKAEERSPQEWQWLNDVLVGGDLAAQGYVVRHLAGTDHLTDEALEALMGNWRRIYTKAPTDVLVWDLLRTLHRRGDPRLAETITESVKQKRRTFRSGVAAFLKELGDPAGLPILYELALEPGKYAHTPGNRMALDGWVAVRAAHEGRTKAEIATEALQDPHFDEAAQLALEKIVARGF